MKYADLSKHRTSDYVFDWDTMLAFDGNTAPYLQYAYTRVVSLFRARIRSGPNRSRGASRIEAPSRARAGAHAGAFSGDRRADVAADALPHYLCGYLYELAARYMQFYEQCPVLNAEPDVSDRAGCCCVAEPQRRMKHGLSLLGIDTVERM